MAFLDSKLEKIKNPNDFYDSVFHYSSPVYPVLDYENDLLDRVHLTNYTVDPVHVIAIQAIQKRYRVSYEMAKEMLYRYTRLGVDCKDIIRGVYENRRNRELEHVSFTFEAPIELSILPQMTRHRVQSLEVPDFVPLWNVRQYLYPAHDEDQNAHIGEIEYDEMFDKNALMMEMFKKEGVRDEDLIYFYLGGNATNIQTTMDLRELIWFSKMRSCNKAQKGIRNISNQMVAEVSRVSSTIGSLLGPSCKVDGFCPEGKDSCKARGVVVLKK